MVLVISFFVVHWSVTQKLAYKKYLLIKPPFPQNKKVVESKIDIYSYVRFSFLFLNSPGTLKGIMGECSARHSPQTQENLLDPPLENLKHHSQPTLYICCTLVRQVSSEC